MWDTTRIAVHTAAQLYLQGYPLDVVAGGLDHNDVLAEAERIAPEYRSRVHKAITKTNTDLSRWVRVRQLRRV